MVWLLGDEGDVGGEGGQGGEGAVHQGDPLQSGIMEWTLQWKKCICLNMEEKDMLICLLNLSRRQVHCSGQKVDMAVEGNLVVKKFVLKSTI